MTLPSPQLVEDAPLRYLLSVPGGTPPASGLWPVLCFLHGFDEAAPMEIHRALTLHGPLRPGNPDTALRDFLVVAPQLPVAGDLWRRSADAVRQIVHTVQVMHAGDPQRTYLTGFSFGGNGVFDLALQQPELWAALWAVDPTRVPERDPGRPIWLSSGEISRWRGTAFIQRLGLTPAADTPSDRVHVDQGLDHVGTASDAYRDARIYAWLLQKRLSPAE